MDFKQAVTTCFRKYADFTGRAGRPEFWWFALFTFIASLLLQSILGNWASGIFNLAVLLPSIAVGTRRLHDVDKSGWLQLLWLIPLLGWAVMIYFLVQPSGAANRFGAVAAVPEVAPGTPGAV